MNVLVTGGAGYIGSACVEELLNCGHAVTVLDTLVEGHRSAVDPRASFVEGDVADRALVEGALRQAKAEAVIHFAAYALVGESMADPAKYFRNNVAGGLELLEATRAAGVKKFVFSSTCATYGIPERVPMTEDLPQRPINPYGESKLMFERILQWQEQIHRLEFVGFRYFNAAGATPNFGEHHRVETHLIPNLLKVALGQKTHCDLFGTDYPTPDGTCVRDYVHVADLAEAHVRALDYVAKGGSAPAFNLGSGHGYSVKQLIETTGRLGGKPVPHSIGARRPGDPPKLVADTTLVRRELGWSPSRDLDAQIDDAIRWRRRMPR